MSVAELNTVDMAEVLTYAYELGDMINQSAEVSDYLYWKGRVDCNPEIHTMVKQLQNKKELFEETQRFDIFTRTIIRLRMRYLGWSRNLNSSRKLPASSWPRRRWMIFFIPCRKRLRSQYRRASRFQAMTRILRVADAAAEANAPADKRL